MGHVIRAAHVSKSYRVPRERQRTLAERALRQHVSPADVDALKDVSAPLALGARFSADCTGRENVYLPLLPGPYDRDIGASSPDHQACHYHSKRYSLRVVASERDGHDAGRASLGDVRG